MSDLVTLVVPKGAEAYPISHGTASFVPYRLDTSDPAGLWLVDVPREAAGHFLRIGGFYMAKSAVAAAAVGPISAPDLARLKHPEGIGVGWSGALYLPDGDGVVAVPPEAVADLMAHGFLPAEPAE